MITNIPTSIIQPLKDKMLDLKKTHGIELFEQAEQNIRKLSKTKIKQYYTEYQTEQSKITEKPPFKNILLKLDQRVIDHINSIQVKYRKKYDTVHSKRTGSQKNSFTFEVNTYEITHSFCAYIWIAEVEKLIYGDLT